MTVWGDYNCLYLATNNARIDQPAAAGTLYVDLQRIAMHVALHCICHKSYLVPSHISPFAVLVDSTPGNLA